MTKKELKELIKEVISEVSDYDKMTPQQKRQYSILRDLGWEYDYSEGGKVYMNRMDRGSDSSSKLATMVIEPDGEHYREKSMNEAGGYEDGIKDAKDRMKYVALRKMEKDHLAKSKITKDIKKQHHLDMADKYLQQALDIAKKHNVVD